MIIQLGTARAKARDGSRVAAINQLRTAIELFVDDSGGTFPATTAALKTTGYISVDPVDPQTLVAYGYGYPTSATSGKYQVWAELENHAKALDSDTDIDGTLFTFGGNATKGTNGAGAANEAVTCATTDATDCVFDLGTP